MGEEGPADDRPLGSSPDDDISDDGPLQPTPADHSVSTAPRGAAGGTLTAERHSLLVGDGCLCGSGAGGAGGVPSSTGAAVTRSRKASSWRSDSALCSVSSGRMAGTPPNPSTAAARQHCQSGPPAPEELRAEHTLTVAGRRRGDHDSEVGRRAGPGDDGRAEEAGGGQLAAGAEPQHLEVAHLAGDAVPLAPPCVPRSATLAAVRQARPGRRARPEGDGGQRELVSRGLDAAHVNEGS